MQNPVPLSWPVSSHYCISEHSPHHARCRPRPGLPILSQPALISDFARRSFAYSVPAIWNKLPAADSLLSDGGSSFKSRLKMFLFNNRFYPT